MSNSHHPHLTISDPRNVLILAGENVASKVHFHSFENNVIRVRVSAFEGLDDLHGVVEDAGAVGHLHDVPRVAECPEVRQTDRRPPLRKQLLHDGGGGLGDEVVEALDGDLDNVLVVYLILTLTTLNFTVQGLRLQNK